MADLFLPSAALPQSPGAYIAIVGAGFAIGTVGHVFRWRWLVGVGIALIVLGALLLPFAADFRWLRERADSPWYPSLRLFRQPQFGDWDSVVKLLRQELSQFGTRCGRAA